MPQNNQKGIAHILVIIILLAGLVAAVYLVQQKTNFFPHAASNPISGPITPTSTPKPTPFLKITDPTTSSSWSLGQKVRIKWDFSGNKKIDIYIRATNNFNNIQRILTGGDNMGYFDWVVVNMSAPREYQVLLRGSDGSQADSAPFMTNKNLPYLYITKPAEGEILSKGLYKITWDYANVPYVSLFYQSIDNTNKRGEIRQYLPNLGYYTMNTFNIPVTGSSERFKIQIEGTKLEYKAESKIFTLKAL